MIGLDQIESSFADSLSPEDAGNCARQFAAAQREMGAFVGAIRRLYEEADAMHAAECWIRLAESEEVPLVDGYPDWRHITVMAASQVAKRRFSSPPPADLTLLAQVRGVVSGPS